MPRRAFGYVATLTAGLALLAAVIWFSSLRSPIKWSFEQKGVLRSISSSRGLCAMAIDYWGGQPKPLSVAGGKADLKRWSDFDNRWRNLVRLGTASDTTRHGFAVMSGLDADGAVVWRIWSAPYWFIVLVLLAPTFIRLLRPRQSQRKTPLPQA